MTFWDEVIDDYKVYLSVHKLFFWNNKISYLYFIIINKLLLLLLLFFKSKRKSQYTKISHLWTRKLLKAEDSKSFGKWGNDNNVKIKFGINFVSCLIYVLANLWIIFILLFVMKKWITIAYRRLDLYNNSMKYFRIKGCFVH